MSVEFYGESPGKFDSRTLNRKTLNRWTGRTTPSGMDSGLVLRGNHLSDPTC